MSNLRIVLFSNVRATRTCRVADRLMREIPGVKVSGIAQRPLQSLPLEQRLIATTESHLPFVFSQAQSGMQRRVYSMLAHVIHGVLWFVHGCPRTVNSRNQFTISRLAEECQQSGCRFLLTDSDDNDALCDFVRASNADLVIMLGDIPMSPELMQSPLRGLIRAFQDKSSSIAKESIQLIVEYAKTGSDSAIPVASFKVPIQSYDALPGLTLKLDLISDDLLVQTVKNIVGDAEKASGAVREWIDKMFSPYVAQIDSSERSRMAVVRSVYRCRSVWKLCMETLLLCSPFFVWRNWYRRWRSQYPVLILAHHLISDRPHRMGTSTTTFWHSICFLKKHYHIVSLSEASQLLRSGNVTRPTVVITFDDGYGENFINMRAVAEEAGIPVVLFVSTEPVDDHREFHHDVVQGAVGALPLTWDQIRYWSMRGAEFGSHTRTHFDCGSNDRARLKSEIMGSKSDLEAQLGKPVRFFAFPFGKQDNMSCEAMELATTTYSYFASCFGGNNMPDEASNQQHLLRKNFYSDLWELELELQSVFDLTDRIRRQFIRKPAKESDSSLNDLSTAPTLAMNGERGQVLPANEVT
jgi:peptidoglycan/xylan/chitin deacetylase (PgdA/CDA1 family)